MNNQILYTKHRCKRYINVKTLVSASMLISLSIILTRFLGVMVPVAGVPGLRISFGSIPIYVSGILFGPLVGGLSGIIADLIGFLMNPMGGAYFPGFTISAAIRGAIPGLVYIVIRSEKIKMNFNIVNAATILILSLGAIKALFYKDILFIKNNIIYFGERKLSIIYIAVFCLIVLLYIMIPIVIGRVTKQNDKLYSIDKIFFVVTTCTIFISIGLNSLWLSILFNKAFLIFLPTRVISSFISIPVHSLILFSITKFFKYIR